MTNEKVHLRRLPKIDTELSILDTITAVMGVQLTMEQPDIEIVGNCQIIIKSLTSNIRDVIENKPAVEL